MNKIIYLLFLLTASTVCYSQTVLQISFENITSASALLYNTRTYKTDTLQVRKGVLEYKGKVDGPTLYWMVVDGYNNNYPINLILSNGRTEVLYKNFRKSEEGQGIEGIYPNTPIFLKDPNKNQAYYSFVDSWKAFFTAIQRSSADNSEKSLAERKATYHAFLNTCDSVIQANSGNFVSAVIIDYLLDNNLLQLETIQSFYDHLAPTVKDSFFGLKIGEYAGKAGKLKPGNTAPAFELVDTENQKYNLPILAGKKVLLHFWSSSCAPCIQEAPELIELAETNKASMVTINVSLDTVKDRWLRGIERAGIGRMKNVCDFTGMQGRIAQDYAVQVVPSYYLLDEAGRIIIKGSLKQISDEIKKSIP